MQDVLDRVELAREMAELKATGKTQVEIAELLETTAKAVSLTLAESRRDTVVDKVAVNRAFKGDWRCYEKLNYWERELLHWHMAQIGRHERDRLTEVWRLRDPEQAPVICDVEALF